MTAEFYLYTTRAMSLESVSHLRSAGPSRFGRRYAGKLQAPPASVVRSRYMDRMAPHRSRMVHVTSSMNSSKIIEMCLVRQSPYHP